MTDAKLRLAYRALARRQDVPSGLLMNGKSPTDATSSCVGGIFGFPELADCQGIATWDFTEEAKSLAAQGSGVLVITPSLSALFQGEMTSEDEMRTVSWGELFVDRLAVNYPWQHSGQTGSLTLTIEEDCPRELKLVATPEIVRPVLPLNQAGGLISIPTMATVEAMVKTCPPENGVPPPSVEVSFEIEIPAPGSPEAGGHDHNTTRPTGTFDNFYFNGGQPTTTCIVQDFDVDGMGSCEVTYHAHDVSGKETLMAEATFPDTGETVSAEPKKISVQIPNLTGLPDDPSRYVLVGAPGNHAGTNDPCRLTPPTSNHPSNHSGTGDLIKATEAIADKMLQDTGILIRVNDVSLPQGGIFDVDNNWSSLPRGHRGHRVEVNVDIGFSGVRNGQCVFYQQNRLQRVIQQSTGKVPFIHSDHFHASVP